MTEGIRTVPVSAITERVAALCVEACTRLPEGISACMAERRRQEPYPPARELLGLMERNAQIARDTGVPICQDTGMAVVYVQLGQDVHLTGGTLEEAINAGVARGYTEGYLRKSVVRDPIRRGNTGDNTPAIVHLRLVSGDRIRLTVAPKGFGSENMSRVAMLAPAQGLEGAKRFIVETARLAGANPCPPMILGIGLGGDFEQVAALAKEALLRDEPNPDPFYAALENELLEEVNALGVGPQGFGGRTTALYARVKAAPTHIASLPVAVNVGCHVTRHASAEL